MADTIESLAAMHQLGLANGQYAFLTIGILFNEIFSGDNEEIKNIFEGKLVIWKYTCLLNFVQMAFFLN